MKQTQAVMPAAEMSEVRRVQCANERGGKEGFGLSRSGSGVRIDTPGVITRTRFTREQALRLRYVLDELLAERGGRR